jgi:hypothetical protein
METVCRSSMEMAAMVPASEMVPMASATTATAAPAVPTAATFGNREIRHAQRCREDNGSDSQRDP